MTSDELFSYVTEKTPSINIENPTASEVLYITRVIEQVESCVIGIYNGTVVNKHDVDNLLIIKI